VEVRQRKSLAPSGWRSSSSSIEREEKRGPQAVMRGSLMMTGLVQMCTPDDRDAERMSKNVASPKSSRNGERAKTCRQPAVVVLLLRTVVALQVEEKKAWRVGNPDSHLLLLPRPNDEQWRCGDSIQTCMCTKCHLHLFVGLTRDLTRVSHKDRCFCGTVPWTTLIKLIQVFGPGVPVARNHIMSCCTYLRVPFGCRSFISDVTSRN